MGDSGAGYPKDDLCPIGSLVFTCVCFTVHHSGNFHRENGRLGWEQKQPGALGNGPGQGEKANGLGQEARGGVANSIPAQASVRVHRV